MIVMVTNVCVQIDAPIRDISDISCIADAERAGRLITVSVAWSQKLVNHWISSSTSQALTIHGMSHFCFRIIITLFRNVDRLFASFKSFLGCCLL